MKYGIYKLALSNITTYHYFNLVDNNEAEKLGFQKVGETRTVEEATKTIKRLYK